MEYEVEYEPSHSMLVVKLKPKKLRLAPRRRKEKRGYGR